MGKIYSIVNRKTNKAYIGQTVHSLDYRIRKHFELLRREAHPNKYLQSSYNKHGKESFQYYVLSEVEDCELNREEIRFIALFQTQNANFGYNLTKGGAGVISQEAQEQNKKTNQNKWPNVLKICPETLEVLAEYPSQNVAAKENNIPLAHINQSCQFKGGKRHGFYWILKTDYPNWKPPLQHRAKPYCLVDEQNIIVDIFRSETEMEKRAKTSKPVIKKRTNTKTPLLVNGEQLFIRSLTREEYHSFNIGTCIDYPREEE